MQHPGSINGFQGNIRRFIKDKHTIITLSNIKENPYVGMIIAKGSHIARNISAILYDQKYDLPKKSAAYEMVKSFSEFDADSAINLYFNLKINQAENYYFSEMEINKVGLKLFFIYKNFTDAIKILNLNILEYPDSYNVYDSMAYVYMNHGDSEKALQAFKKGMEVYNIYPEQNEQYEKDYTRAQKHINQLEVIQKNQ